MQLCLAVPQSVGFDVVGFDVVGGGGGACSGIGFVPQRVPSMSRPVLVSRRSIVTKKPVAANMYTTTSNNGIVVLLRKTSVCDDGIAE